MPIHFNYLFVLSLIFIFTKSFSMVILNKTYVCYLSNLSVKKYILLIKHTHNIVFVM